MAKLTDIEYKLLDQYLVQHNFIEISEAHFFNALGNVVPTWRLEQLGSERVYDFKITEAYTDYINKLTKDFYENK